MVHVRQRLVESLVSSSFLSKSLEQRPMSHDLPPLVLPADAGELTRLGPLLWLLALVLLPAAASRSVKEAASEGG